MMRARQLGMLTYRGRDELDTRFGKLLPHLDRPPVAEYLDHHGRRFAERFPVKTFLLLSEAIDRESMGDAQAVRDACARVNAETIVVGVPGDMLFPWALQVELHRALQAAGADSSLWKLESLFGHDAFLADQDRLADLLRGAGAFGKPLKTASRPRFEGVGVEPVREIRIGLVGCGTVGRGLLEMIDRQSGAIADRYGVQVPRVAHRGARRHQGSRSARDRHSDHRSRARARQRSRSRCRRRSRGRHGGRADPGRGARRRQAGGDREQGAARIEARRARRAGAADRNAALLRGRGRRGDSDRPSSQSSRRRDRQPLGHRQRDLQLHHDAARAGRSDARCGDRRSAAARIRGSRSERRSSTATMRRRSCRSSPIARLARGCGRTDSWCAAFATSIRPIAISPSRWASASARSRARCASTARSTWRSSRCCCRRGTCSHRSKRNTTPSICAACRRAT